MENLLSKNNLKQTIVLVLLFLSLGINFAKASDLLSQRDIISISERLRINEIELRRLNDYKDLLLAKQKQHEQQLEFFTSEITNNIIALYKLSIVSLNLLFSSEQSKKDLLISYSLLRYYTQYIKNEIMKTKEYIDIINKSKLETKKIENKILQNNIEIKQYTQSFKNHIFAINNSANINEINKIKKKNSIIISESKNISTLIKNLNTNHYLRDEITIDKEILNEKGNFVWPNSGFLDSDFKKSSNKLYINGIVLLALPNTQIVAPYDGEVIFVDYFNDFNNVIIIKHSPSLYSVISGKISPFIRQTQLVKKHEPIAISNRNISPLYFEIKYNNQSTNPLLWLQNRSEKKD